MNGNHHFSCSSTRFDAQIIRELDPTYWKSTVAQHNGMIEVLGIRDLLYLHTKKNTDERSGGHVEDVRVIVLSKTRPVSLIRQVYEARHRCFGEKLSSRIHRKGSSARQDLSLLSDKFTRLDIVVLEKSYLREFIEKAPQVYY
ncbi:proline synthase co-transcribed bacterial homolog protein-like protein [Tanacetum coccineum]|uniref:Proline synthase co-transcribed bacterial homolog protein-like protein n=1 Tax=Tanacetum coccineum TaxID=301880 RepID=A0ABQ5HJ93_9ASTR